MSDIRGSFLSWSLSVDQISSRTSALIERARRVYDSIAKITDPTIENVAEALCYFEAESATESEMLIFPKSAHSDKAIRDASVEASKKLSDLEIELAMRKDVFDVFVLLESKLDSSVDPELRRYVQRKIRDGRRNGLHLDDAQRKKIEALSKEENKLSIDFNHNLNEDNTTLEFTKEELAGCPEDFIANLQKTASGKLEVTLKYPHYFPVSENARNPETRRLLEKAFNSRCMETNKPILRRLLEIREERARILGFPTHADYILEVRMAQNAKNVTSFLLDTAEKVEPLRQKEYARMLELKKEECEKLGLPFVNRIEPWDFRYYVNMAKERDYSVDHQKLKVYFPMKVVRDGILRLYQHLLGLTFARVETSDVWHTDAELYSVTDTETNRLMGYFYLDLHPREGKYGHAAVFGLQRGCMRRCSAPSGEGHSQTAERQIPIVAMLANFTAPSESQPEAFMLHEEVDTFFHEFGHAMHGICSNTKMAIFSWEEVERDFVECPSQMLENWVWCEEGLKAILGDKATPIPTDLMQNLINSRTAMAGTFNARQLLLGTFDQAIHTERWKEDVQQVYSELSRKMLNVEPSPDTCMPATFMHMTGGYDAQYYGYMWSLVFSADLFETKFRNAPDGGCLSPTVGREYREKILKPGASKDASDMLRDFLGREPNNKAFLKLIGVEG